MCEHDANNEKFAIVICAEIVAAVFGELYNINNKTT